MSSVIHYKFKNAAKRFDVIAFEGNILSVADLKKHIAREKKLGKTEDFDLMITNAQTGEDYRDEGFLISKNTSVVVRRVPSVRARKVVVAAPEPAPAPAAATDPAVESAAAPLSDSSAAASNYPQTSKPTYNAPTGPNANAYTYTAPPAAYFAPRPSGDDFGGSIFDPSPTVTATGADAAAAGGGDSEEAQMQAVLRQSQTLASTNPAASATSMANNKYMDRSLPGSKPPPGYVCHRCMKPGHFIRNCPTNADPNYDFRSKATVMNRPLGAGLPRSFLKPIEDPKGVIDAAGQLGTSNPAAPNASAAPGGGGGHSVSGPRVGVQAYGASGAPVAFDESGIAPNRTRLRAELLCPICSNHYRNAMVISCCHTTFCDECIRQALVSEGNFACPLCKTTPINPDTDLKPNARLQASVDEFVQQQSALQSQQPQAQNPQLAQLAAQQQQQQAAVAAAAAQQSRAPQQNRPPAGPNAANKASTPTSAAASAPPAAAAASATPGYTLVKLESQPTGYAPTAAAAAAAPTVVYRTAAPPQHVYHSAPPTAYHYQPQPQQYQYQPPQQQQLYRPAPAPYQPPRTTANAYAPPPQYSAPPTNGYQPIQSTPVCPRCGSEGHTADDCLIGDSPAAAAANANTTATANSYRPPVAAPPPSRYAQPPPASQPQPQAYQPPPYQPHLPPAGYVPGVTIQNGRPTLAYGAAAPKSEGSSRRSRSRSRSPHGSSSRSRRKSSRSRSPTRRRSRSRSKHRSSHSSSSSSSSSRSSHRSSKPKSSSSSSSSSSKSGTAASPPASAIPVHEPPTLASSTQL